MSVLIAFIPWLFYWVFMSAGKMAPGMWLAFISGVGLGIYEWRKGSLKTLTVGTAVYFFLMVLLVSLTRPSRLWYFIPLMGNLALALIVLASIMMRKPFTLQYAMETAPKERWSDPGFIHANYVITWGWFIAFMFMAIPSCAVIFKFEVPIWFNWAFSLCCMVAANRFTEWYKNKSRRTAQK